MISLLLELVAVKEGPNPHSLLSFLVDAHTKPHKVSFLSFVSCGASPSRTIHAHTNTPKLD